MCLLCAATPSICSIASNVLVGRARMMTYLNTTSSYDCCLNNLLTFCHILQRIAICRCRWLRLQDSQGDNQDLLLVGSLATHAYVFLIESFILYVVSLVLVASACYICGSFNMISSTFQQKSNRHLAWNLIRTSLNPIATQQLVIET